jgi:RNA polymerase sigma-70 factor (ECF subfamily)
MSSDFTGSTALARTTLEQTTRATHADSRVGVLEEEVMSLFDELRDPLLRYLSSLGIAVADGEEVIQESFLSLFEHLRSGKSRENLRGWLFRVAHNVALKRRYRNRRDLEVRAGAGAEDVVEDPGPNPEDQLLNSQTQRHLQAVIRALPEQDRRCLFLRAEGLRYRGIAKVLDMSLGGVSLSLARSLARVARAAERCKL